MQTWFPIVRDAVLFALAIYGAILSTFNWRQAAKKDRRQITVNASTARPTFGSELGAPFAKVEAVNIGHRVVTVKTLAFETSSGARLTPMLVDRFPGMPDTKLPVSLSDGQSAHLLLPYSDIAGALLSAGQAGNVKLTPICVDTSDNVYRGEAWDVDPKEFLRMSSE
ncbi:hypothetical protein [Bradyrhizobium sp. SZCCHNR2035]|uniref:hypothetical protein n=1 Tax=Bradyrhizobium sp. SZCCHNR2035 TaxID=3057386 RepID=UPI002916D608|nr:hypothetical protein [Bradyrhizobium sp. SZCCHNR2035]